MPDPVRAWAAVAPDGTICVDSARTDERAAWLNLRMELDMIPRKQVEADGWQVVPVMIVPLGGNNGE